MKKYKNHLLVFLIPVIIILIALLFNGFYPFGNKILLMIDGYNQYPGFLNTFKEVIFHRQSWFYSFNGLTGFNLYASLGYYTFNITNILFLFFKTNHIVDFYTIIIIVKIALASLSMFTYLNYINNKKYNILFSICYALTSYNLLYYLNYMWFDSIILLPLVILGIEKIFKENKYYYYTIALSLSIIFNFYIGYMICIFSVLYFIYKWIMDKCSKEKIIKYIIYSLLAGLISSFVLVPVILELLNGKGLLFSNSQYFNFDLDFISVFYKLSIGSYLNGDLEYGTPNVYVSIFIFFNSLLFFFNKKITLKEKILAGSILLFFLLSMSFNLLDYFWQMMQMPIYYPVRYAFIFDSYLIYLAYRNYMTYEKLTTTKNIIVFIIITVLFIIGFFTSGNLLDKVNVPAKMIYLGISLLFLLYYIFIINSNDFKKYIWIVIIIELSVNTFVTFRNNGNINTIDTFKDSYEFNYEILKRLDLDSFNRLVFDKRTIKNNGLLLNYNDLNYFSSVRNNKTYTLLNKVLGVLTIDGCNLEYYYNNPINNALLNIKYYITKTDLNYYELIDTYKNYNIYQNNDITAIGFGTNKIDIKIEDDYFININNLVKVINGNDKNILNEVQVSDKNISCNKNTNVCITNGSEGYINYHYTALDDELIFIQNDYPTSIIDKTDYEIIINGKSQEYNTHYPIRINKKDVVELTVKPNENFKDYYYHFYTVNLDIYQEFVKNINKNKLELTEYKNDANFKGKITMDKDGVLFTTISNDKGWTIYVDGKKQDISPILDGFIGLDLSEGLHEIVFKYTPPGIEIGFIISGLSLMTFSLLLIIDKRKTSN